MHDTEVAWDEGFWNERYRSSAAVWSGNPNPQLVAEVADLEPGRALMSGAARVPTPSGWPSAGRDVVATDISSVALERRAQHARQTDPGAGARIEWRQADLLVNPPERDSYDLVSAQFMQLSPGPRTRLFSALAASVRTGGALLVVGHDPSDMTSGVQHPATPDLYYAADDVARLLDASWTVVTNGARSRSATTPAGAGATVHDAVLLAIRS